MKFLLLISLLFASACGIEAPPEQDIEVRLDESIEPDENDTFSQLEVQGIQRICSALDDKAFYFENAARTSRTIDYEFNLYSKTCGEENYLAPVNIMAEVSEVAGSFRYSTDSANRKFNSEVIVSESKALNDICEGASVTTKRFNLSGDYGVWMEVLNNNSGACASRLKDEPEPDTGSTECLVLTTAKIEASSGKYRVQSVELLEIVTESGDIKGTVFKRKSSFICGEDKSETLVQLNRY